MACQVSFVQFKNLPNYLKRSDFTTVWTFGTMADTLLLFFLHPLSFLIFLQEIGYSVLYFFNNRFRNTEHGDRINFLECA